MKLRWAALVFLPLIVTTKAYCQQDSVNQNDHIVVGAKLHYGSVYVHTSAIKNIAGAKPFGVEFEYSKQKINERTYNLCGCYPRSGFVAAYYNLGNKILGHAIVVGYFLEPNYKINKSTQFFLRGTAGVTYVTNPYHVLNNPDNHNYTVHINPFLQVGMGFNLL